MEWTFGIGSKVVIGRLDADKIYTGSVSDLAGATQTPIESTISELERQNTVFRRLAEFPPSHEPVWRLQLEMLSIL